MWPASLAVLPNCGADFGPKACCLQPARLASKLALSWVPLAAPYSHGYRYCQLLSRCCRRLTSLSLLLTPLLLTVTGYHLPCECAECAPNPTHIRYAYARRVSRTGALWGETFRVPLPPPRAHTPITPAAAYCSGYYSPFLLYHLVLLSPITGPTNC